MPKSLKKTAVCNAKSVKNGGLLSVLGFLRKYYKVIQLDNFTGE